MFNLGSTVGRPVRIRYFKNLSTATRYDFNKIERKWQEYWLNNSTFATIRRPGHKKKYVLDMFPYPSGAGLHVGHPEGYTATDIMARYWRMNDFDVLHPMGWDSFGLPAEQHAIATGTHPAITTQQNIANFKRQLQALGFSYDWNLELATTNDDYVRWTQWIFLKFYHKGLAVQKEQLVNWCAALGTVLSNEEVTDGLSERGSHPVVRVPLRQWVLRITEYADRLERDLAGLDWPSSTLQSQRQWIGRSEGTQVQFTVEGHPSLSIDVFTTRVETLLGVTYLVLAPEHCLVSQITAAGQAAQVQQYQAEVSLRSDLLRTATAGKTGACTGAFALHPLTQERIPIWVADYVLMSYGTGAVMAVPGHDLRDHAFAQLFNLPIKQVIVPTCDDVKSPSNGEVMCVTGAEGGIMCNSGTYDNFTTDDCARAITAQLQQLKKGESMVSYKLRDWVFSRQRYWGEPIPIYYPVTLAPAGGQDDTVMNPILGTPYTIDYSSPIAVEDHELPLKLPPLTNFQPDGDDPQGCLARALAWRFFQKDGKWYARECNTMPQWAGSCWYYLRFTDPHNHSAVLGSAAAEWLPVDLYVGGQEHACLHLLYARFWHKLLHDVGVVDHSEPFTKLVHQGLILGTDGEKMSKSRGNVVNPDDIIREHGADALRLYEMFMGPLEAVKPWQTEQISGVVRFRDRVFGLLQRINNKNNNYVPNEEIEREMHRTIKKVTADIERMSFNTAISSMMVLVNSLYQLPSPPKHVVESLVLLLSPFAPHLCEEAWEALGHQGRGGVSKQSWPVHDEAQCAEQLVSVTVQVNGRVRAVLQLGAEQATDKATVVQAMQECEQVQKHIAGKAVKRVIFVPGKTISLLLDK